MVVVLKPLQIATTTLCKDLNISCSLIPPIVNGPVKNHLVVSLVTAEDLSVVKRFKEIVIEELQCRFPFDANSVSVLAGAVDPCFHQLKCFSTEQQQVHSRLYEEDTRELCEPLVKKGKETTFCLDQMKTKSQMFLSGKKKLKSSTKNSNCITMKTDFVVEKQ